MAANKTVPTEIRAEEFVASVEHDTRRADAEALLDLMSRVTGYKAKMWGPAIVGFGRYHYVYESGREGDYLMVGFSPRKANLSVYLMPGYDDFSDQLARLGKHKKGKSCLYLNKLSDIDLSVLEEMIAMALESVRSTYDTFDE